MLSLQHHQVLSDLALRKGSNQLCREVTSETAAVLHYTFTQFKDLKARRDRCDCAPTEEDAKRCFILPFDRMVRRLSSCTSCGKPWPGLGRCKAGL